MCACMHLSSLCLPYYGFQFSLFVEFLSVKKWVYVSSAFLGPSLFCLFSNFDLLAFVLSYYIRFYFFLFHLILLLSLRIFSLF